MTSFHPLFSPLVGRDFFVGVTEAMNSLLVLIAIEMQWPLSYLCCIPRNVNHQNAGRAAMLREPLLEHSRQKLAPDIEIYDHAKKVHGSQVAVHGKRHAATLAQFEHADFSAVVCRRDVAHEVSGTSATSKEGSKG